MTEMDWADTEAKAFCALFLPDHLWPFVNEALAAALRAAERRGRAAGLREAAEILYENLGHLDGVNEIRQAASKLDPTD